MKNKRINLKFVLVALFTAIWFNACSQMPGLDTTGPTVTGSEAVTGETLSPECFSPVRLVWHDEFNTGNTINPSKWSSMTGNGFYSAGQFIAGWGNNELEYYTDRPENLSVSNGSLFLTARKENYTGEAGGAQQLFQYTSSRVRTKGHFSRTYGLYEIRAKLPVGQGIWPALWMLPEDDSYGGWASSGEIDIMEALGQYPDRVNGTIQFGSGWPNNFYSGKQHILPRNGRISEWHTYSIVWLPGQIAWYVDNKLYSVKSFWWSSSVNGPSSDADLNPYGAPFDKPFHLLLNVAVGGYWPGNPDSTTVFPQTMEVDYVRVYSLPFERMSPGERPLGRLPWLTVNSNLVFNGSFDWKARNPYVNSEVSTISGATNTWFWTYFYGEGASGSITNEKGTLHAIPAVPGAAVWSHQVRQDNFCIASLGKYQVKFKAWSKAPRTIMVKVGGNSDRGYTAYSGEQTILLSTNSGEEHSFLFDMTYPTDDKARLEFNIGGNSSDVYLDDVSVTRAGTLSVRQPDATGSLVYNGGFSMNDPSVVGITTGGSKLTGSDYWSLWYADWTGMTVIPSIDAGSLKLLVNNLNSDNNWHIQLIQKGIPILKDKSYTLTFSAKADSPRTATVIVGEDGGSYARYNGNGQGETIALTTTEQTFTINFTMNQNSNYLAIVQLLLASGTNGESYSVSFSGFRLVQNN